jgi:hypothetical protein
MMSDESDKPGDVRFSVSARQFQYLSWLVRNTVLGKTENEVAKQILTQRLSEMRQESFREDGRA